MKEGKEGREGGRLPSLAGRRERELVLVAAVTSLSLSPSFKKCSRDDCNTPLFLLSPAAALSSSGLDDHLVGLVDNFSTQMYAIAP